MMVRRSAAFFLQSLRFFRPHVIAPSGGGLPCTPTRDLPGCFDHSRALQYRRNEHEQGSGLGSRDQVIELIELCKESER